MRRLWAHILMAAASVVTVATVFPLFVEQTQTNIEYSRGKEIVFKITENDEEGSKQVLDDQVAVKEIAEVMKNRLDIAGVSRYGVNIEGNDTVRVGFYKETEEEYSNLCKYLSFNGSLALTSKFDKENPDNFKFLTGEEFRIEGSKAYRGTKTYESNNVPVFVLPVSNTGESWKALIEEAKKHEVPVGEAAEGEEQQTAAFLYLWYNFSNHPETDLAFWDVDNEDAKNNYFLTQFVIDEENPENMYLTGKDDNRLFSYEQDALNPDPAIKRKGYDKLDLMVNLLNAEPLNYKVTQANSINEAQPWVEPLVTYTSTSMVMAFNKTVVATVCAVIIISLLLAIFFRLGALSIASTSLVSLLLAYGSMLMLSAEYTTLTLFALIAVAMVSMASGVIYCCKLRNECYKGRTLKKANSEASKKSVLPICDVHVGLALIGIFTYLFGGTICRSFGVVTFLGAIASLIINLVWLRANMWLATNSTKLAGKYSTFGVDPAKVPDPMKEEKQTYFGEYADRKVTKNKKVWGIVGAVLTLVTLAGAITFSVIPVQNGGGTYRKKQETVASKIYLDTTRAESDALNEETIAKLLDNIILYEGDYDPAKQYSDTLKSHVTNYEFHTDTPYVIYYTYVPEGNEPGDNTKKYYSVVVNLDKPILASQTALYRGHEEECAANKLNVNEVLTTFACVESGDSLLTMSLKEGQVYTTGDVNVGTIALGSAVAVLVMAVYLILRYKLSRGLSSLAVVAASGIITFGLFSVTRLAVTNYVAAITPLVCLFAMIVSIILMNRERELVLESKTKELSLEDRQNIMERSSGMAFTTILILSIVTIYLAINFFGFANIQVAMPFALMTICCIFVVGFVVSVQGPLACALGKKFANVKLPERKRKPKANAVMKKSAEPEEAIFPGIND